MTKAIDKRHRLSASVVLTCISLGALFLLAPAVRSETRVSLRQQTEALLNQPYKKRPIFRLSHRTQTYVLKGLDLSLTCYALQRGAVEQNPLFGRSAGCRDILLASAVTMGLTTFLLRHESKNSRGWKWGKRISWLPVLWNAFQLHELRR